MTRMQARRKKEGMRGRERERERELTASAYRESVELRSYSLTSV